MISRRTFLQSVIAGTVVPPLHGERSAPVDAPDVLYNGITLGQPWPPRLRYVDERPIRPPYLVNPPDVVPIDVGRQLFVDDFLIQETTLRRSWHQPAYHPASPVLQPDRPWELRDELAERTKSRPNSAAMVFSDGVFYDPRDRVFKIWYMGGYSGVDLSRHLRRWDRVAKADLRHRARHEYRRSARPRFEHGLARSV